MIFAIFARENMALCSQFYNDYLDTQSSLANRGFRYRRFDSFPPVVRHNVGHRLFLDSSDSLIMSSTILRHSNVEPPKPGITESNSFMRINEPEEDFHLFAPIKRIHMVRWIVRIIIVFKCSQLDLDSLSRCSSFLRLDHRPRIRTSA